MYRLPVRIFLVWTALWVAPVDGDLVLSIDPTLETFELSGEDSGNFDWSSGVNAANWFLSVPYTPSQTIFNEQDPATVVGPFSQSSSQLRTTEFGSTDSFISLNHTFNSTQDVSGTSATITALGGKVDYSTHSQGFKDAFKDMIGGTIPLSAGSNFSPIRVVAVPEPSAVLLQFSCAAIALLLTRLKHVATLIRPAT